MTATTDERRLWGDDEQPIRIPGDERPADAREDLGHSRFTVGLDALCQPDLDAPNPERHPNYRGAPSADPIAAHRQSDWPEPPDYGHPPTRTGELLLEIDQQIAGSLAARNQRLRLRIREAEANLASERSARQEVQVRLNQAETERDRLKARVEQLELTVKALAKDADQAAGRDNAGSGEEGGQ